MRRAVLVLAVLIATAVAAPAGSQPRGVAVAGPVAGATLYAYDEGSKLCVELEYPHGGSGGCDSRSPRSPWDVSPEQSSSGATGWWSAAVPPQVAAVELQLADGTRVRAQTTAGDAYHGAYAGQARFALVAYRGDESLELARLLGAGGEVLAAFDGADFRFDGPPGDAVRLERGRTESLAWSVFAYAERRLAPTPLQPDRLERRGCVALYGKGPRRQEAGPFCLGPSDVWADRTMTVVTGGGCDGQAIVGLAAPSVVRAVVVLGDGARRRLVTHRSPMVLGARRAFGTIVDPRSAVRAVLGFDRGGHRVARWDLRRAPSQAQCPPPSETTSSAIGYGGSFVSADEGRRVVAAHDPALVAEDRGDLLCLGPGRLLPGRRDCGLPPVRTFDSRLVGVRGAGRTLLAGVVSTDVTAVELILDGGERRRLPAGPSAAYSGKYRGRVAFVSLDLPGRRSVLRVRLLGKLGPQRWFVDGLDPRPSRRARIADGSGPVLWALQTPGYPHDKICVRLAVGWCQSGDSYSATVRCGQNSGGTFVAGLVPHRARRVVGILRSGERVAAEVRRLPAGFVRRPRAWRLALAPGQALSRIVAVGGAGGSAWEQLPPARRQCGYDDFGSLDGGGF